MGIFDRLSGRTPSPVKEQKSNIEKITSEEKLRTNGVGTQLQMLTFEAGLNPKSMPKIIESVCKVNDFCYNESVNKDRDIDHADKLAVLATLDVLMEKASLNDKNLLHRVETIQSVNGEILKERSDLSNMYESYKNNAQESYKTGVRVGIETNRNYAINI